MFILIEHRVHLRNTLLFNNRYRGFSIRNHVPRVVDCRRAGYIINCDVYQRTHVRIRNL